MKAVVYKEKKQVSVEQVDKPKIKDKKDAIIKVSSAAVCGSDLHMYDGRTTVGKTILGHEIMGEVAEVGDAVTSIKVGDRVVLPFNISCGVCSNCTKGLTSACLTANPDGVGAAYGYAEMGPYEGGQAEFVRVPYADFNCLKLPGTPGDEYENDFLMLADIFPTGYHACEMAHVGPGSTVAIFGAGPVGLLAAHSAFIRGASEVYVVDQSETRLKLAERLGAIPINLKKGSPAQQIMNLRKKNPLIRQSLRPGEEKAMGVMCGIDAVGYEGLNVLDPSEEDPSSILKELVELVNPGGHIGIIGVYADKDPEAKDAKKKEGIFDVPLGKIFSKGLSIQAGQTPVKKYNIYLRDLIIAGVANPGVIVSHEAAIEKAPEVYRVFDKRGIDEGKDVTKVVLKP